MTTLKHQSLRETTSPNRRWRTWLKRAVIACLIALVGLPALGASYQVIATARDLQTYPPPGQLVEVGGYKLHLYSQGENQGNPTVILLGCGGCMSPNWGWVQPAVAKFTRVVAYDRAGFGWSEPAPMPLTPDQSVAELRIALEKAGIPAPYLLVGHSYGGLLANLFAARYPDEVVGMVLIDPRHPDQDKRWPAAARAAAESESSLVRLLGWLARVGFLRLTDIGYQQASDLPPQQAAEYAALWATTQFWQTIQAQAAALPQLDAALGDNHRLGDLPLIVLSADTAWLTPGAPADDVRQVYTTLNLEQATFSSNSLHRTVEGASHTSLVNKEADAQVTIAAIRQVIEASKTGSSLR